MRLKRVLQGAGLGLLLLALTALPRPLRAQNTFDVKASYSKSEHMIPMRDGVKLFAAVYAPKDTSQKYPILLNRTPYSCAPYGGEAYKDTIGPSEQIAREGYIIVYQDVRGSFMSEGVFVNMRPQNDHKRKASDIDESSDTYDTIDWLVKNIPNNNGRVGMWGISYPGFYTAVGTIDAHPALKAASPQAPISDWFMGDDFHHNGTFFLPHAFNFFANFGRARPKPATEFGPPFNHGTPDGYKFFLEMGPLANADKHLRGKIAFWHEIMRHPNYDAWWQARNTRPHLHDIKPAVMTVGGWFDAENLFGALATYKSIEKQSPGTYNILVMGPWFHGGWARSDGDALGDVRFGAKTSFFYRENIELPFFNYYLKDKVKPGLPEAYVFETGSNQWKTYQQWPPANVSVRNLFLGANRELSFSAPGATSPAYDEYISDPATPVPFINNIAIGMTREYMVDDQRFAARRPDVLVYQTEVLQEDVTIAGPVAAHLIVSTSGTDSDFIVKLIDVYPDDAPDNQPNPTGMKMGGYQMLVRGEPMRARFRNSFVKPEPMIPPRPVRIEYVMPDVNHNFMKGHRVMVHVQSTWFPLVDRNPQKFVDIYTAREPDFQKATQRIYHSSHLILNVVK